MTCDLRVRRELLNPRFEGYKLSLDDFPVKQVPTLSGVYQVADQPDLFSLQHFKVFSPWNCLYLDPYFPKSVYHVNTKREIVCHNLSEGSSAERSGSAVAALPHSDTSRNLHISLHFSNAFYVVLSDGSGGLLVGTGDRGKQIWTLQKTPYHSAEDFRVVASKVGKIADKVKLDVVLLKVEDKGAALDGESSGDRKKADRAGPQFVTVLEWIVVESGEKSEWTVSRTRRFEGSAAPHYVALEENGDGLSIAGDSSFSITFDSEQPLPSNGTHMDTDSIPQTAEPAYTWSQTEEDVTVFIPVSEGTQKSSVRFKLGGRRLELEDDTGGQLLNGELNGPVDSEMSVWVLEANRIELTLAKKAPGRWERVLKGDNSGKEIPTEAQAKEISDRLASITAENYLESANNPQQLEECDDFPEDAASWVRFDGKSNRITHKVDISSHQYLFNATPNPDQMPGLCLRHDVDGLIFAALESVDASNTRVPPFDHIGTFDALGYVMASKRDKKFACCAPNLSFAALSDPCRNVYVYRNDVPVETELKNRKTGQIIKSVAKQHVITLENTTNTLGFAADNDSIFILKDNALIVINL